MDETFPISVRYVKNGRGGQWWPEARQCGQIHLGWKNIPKAFLRKPDFRRIKERVDAEYGLRRGATQDFNALCEVLDSPSKHIWITFEDGYLWWCMVLDGTTVNPAGESIEKGNFWLTCSLPWSNRSLCGKLLAVSDLPGTVTTTGGFQGTVCTPRDWHTVIRIIHDEKDPDVAESAAARRVYREAIQKVVKRLSWKDFEQLIDLILARTGWVRVSTLAKTREGIDLEVENLTAAELAFVQVKSSASQEVLMDYVQRFEMRREHYARMIFAVHSPVGKLSVPANHSGIQLWTGDHIAQMVVRLGLGEWVESRFA